MRSLKFYWAVITQGEWYFGWKQYEGNLSYYSVTIGLMAIIMRCMCGVSGSRLATNEQNTGVA